MPTVEELLAQMEAQGVELVRFLYVDVEGVPRGYVVPRDRFADDVQSGHPVALAMPFFSAFDTLPPSRRFGPAGEWRTVADLSTFRILPYAEKTAAVLCEFRTHDLEPTDVDPRAILRKTLGNLGFQAKVALESEFYLLQRDASGKLQPFDNSLCFGTEGMNAANAFVLDVVSALREQGIEVEKYYPEYGPGQHEIAYRYGDAMEAADNHIFFRETVRALAARHGLIATFIPKPFAQHAGSGGHIHVSLWDGGRNVFHDASDPLGLSRLAYHFIGGLLKHGRALTAFTAPSIPSYKRFIPHAWAGAYLAYGADNREAVVRVPSPMRGREEATTNLELKAADGTCNPYLAVAAVLVAGMDGVRNEIHPGDALDIDPGLLAEDVRLDRKIHPLPGSLAEAVDELERSELFWEAFGQEFMEEYINLKRHNWQEYLSRLSDWEIERYIRAF